MPVVTRDGNCRHPGPSLTQFISGTDVLNQLFFLTGEEWDRERVTGDYDYIVIGSSFCALAFIKRALVNNPRVKILVIERGHLFHQEHFQNLPPHFKRTVGDCIETFPWTITEKTKKEHGELYLRGTINYFGGRSCVWSGWVPKPSKEELEGWPEELKDRIYKYFKEAEDLLHVVPANEICQQSSGEEKAIYGELQRKLGEILGEKITDKHITSSVPAPLAVGAGQYRNEEFHKFSVPESLIELSEKGQVKMVANCTVELIHHDEVSRAVSLKTSQGDVAIGKAKLILAMGVLPGTTLILNSFPKERFPLLSGVGERFTAHVISSVTARIPVEHLINRDKQEELLQIGAMYIKGHSEVSQQQFHIQLTAVHDSDPDNRAHVYKRHHYMPDIFSCPSELQLRSSKDHVIIVCSALGELDYNNKSNWFRQMSSTTCNEKFAAHNIAGEHSTVDTTTNVGLQVVPNDNDAELWDVMDASIFRVFEGISQSSGRLEYWHNSNDGGGEWKRERPSDSIRTPSLVHESSTMWIGGDDSPVGLDYRPRGIDNVYITGGSLWPTGGSWNPTGAMVALATHLADQLCPVTNTA